MIYTCTLNPSLDYYMEFENLNLGAINRSTKEFFEPGGKGINVSIVLNNFKISTRALGFVGGFTKEYFVKRLQKYEYIQPNFTYIEEATRINVKIYGQNETDLNAKGPKVTEEEKNQMLKRVERLNPVDILVLSGSCPDNCFDMAEKMMQICKENNTEIVLDCKPSTMKAFLKYKPLLVKPNHDEIEEMFGVKLNHVNDIIHYAKEIVAMGAKNCLVSLGKEGAILVNSEGVYRSGIVDGEVISTTGAGDSVVAGFLMSYLRTRDIVEIFRYASASGSATALSEGLATREKIEEIVNEIQIIQVE